MKNLEKSWKFIPGLEKTLKVLEKSWTTRNTGTFTHAEIEFIDKLFKDRRSKYTPAYEVWWP